MRVVVGTENGPKCSAVDKAFSDFLSQEIKIIKCAANSGVSSHPTSGSESLNGAINRINHAKSLVPDADYYVGIEGGLLTVNSRTWELGFIAIQNSEGVTHTAVSAGIELSGNILNEILAGTELSKVLESRFNVKNAGMKNGFYGITTNDLVTREKAYYDAIIFALAPFAQPQYFE